VTPLEIIIPGEASFYSLYADGLFSGKTLLPESDAAILAFPENALIFLYYTYPAHREACAVRNSTTSGARSLFLPGLSKRVSLLFAVHASRVDKLRRAVSFLNTHSSGAYSFGDGFYIRLRFLLCQRGKLNYPALRMLADSSPRFARR
jgi:hypothetical protein